MTRAKRAAITLAGAVLIALILLSVVNAITKGRIEKAEHALRLENLSAVLPQGSFDESPVLSQRQHVVPELGGAQAMDVYTAYTDGEPAAAVLELIAPDGYSGNIRILLGVHYTGDIVAARVIEHKETPGLGDGIEFRKSDWITQFDGKSLSVSEPAHWRVKTTDARFDALTGATITSRAVVQTIHRALQWYDVNRDEVFTHE